jgi:hypothetical protein
MVIRCDFHGDFMGFSLPKNGAKIGMAHGDMNGFFRFFPPGIKAA